MRHFRDRPSPHVGPSPESLAALHESVAEAIADHREQRLLLRALRRLPLDLQKRRLRKARQLLAAQMADIADSRELLESTTTGLDGWVGSSSRAALELAAAR